MSPDRISRSSELDGHQLDDSGIEFAQRKRVEALRAGDPAGILLSDFVIDNRRLPTPAEQAAIDELAKRDTSIISNAMLEGTPRNVAAAELVLDQTIESGPVSE